MFRTRASVVGVHDQRFSDGNDVDDLCESQPRGFFAEGVDGRNGDGGRDGDCH